MPDIYPHSVIHGLPVMSFRGLDAPPYDVAGFDFSHSHGRRPYPYINGVAHDWTGLDDQKIGFTLYFLNTLEAGAFPDTWEEWRRELFDGNAGKMVHPLLGPVQVVVRSGSVKLEARSTAGIVAQVQFESTIIDPEEEQTYETIRLNVKKAITMAAAAAEEHGIDYPSESGATDITQAGAMIDGAITQAEMAVDGLIGDVQNALGSMIDIADTLGHSANAARDSFVTAWAALEDLGKKVGVQQERDVGTVQIAHDTTLDAFARERGNTLAEIMSLNPSALVSPSVQKGTALRYYIS